ncbi:MAG: hypothetical protein M3Q65_02495, partial [Chloroflexota bacterium]|nr:hypothetical protein [Chloroflexota bacterium]
CRPLRLAAAGKLERVAHRVAADLRAALGVAVEVAIYRGEELLEARRRLAERATPREWDIMLLEQTAQTADAPTLELHRAFVGATGEYRAGPVVPAFEALWADLVGQTSRVRQSGRRTASTGSSATRRWRSSSARRRRSTRSTGTSPSARTARRSILPRPAWAPNTGRAGDAPAHPRR